MKPTHRISLVFSTVLSLLRTRRPTAVSGLVIAVVVGVSVKFHSCRALSHIGEKVLERVDPPGTNLDPAIQVVSGNLLPFRPTALLHRVPCLVGWSSGHTVPEVVRIAFKRLHKQTSATPGSPRAELVGGSLRFLPASAPANAPRASLLRVLSLYPQSPERLADDAYSLHAASHRSPCHRIQWKT